MGKLIRTKTVIEGAILLWMLNTGLPQVALAKALRVENATLTSWKKGKVPHVRYWKRIEELTGIKLYEILFDQELKSLVNDSKKSKKMS